AAQRCYSPSSARSPAGACSSCSAPLVVSVLLQLGALARLLHPDREELAFGDRLAAEHVGVGAAAGFAAAAEGKTAAAALGIAVVDRAGILALVGRNDEAVLIVGNGHVAIHVLDHVHIHADALEHLGALLAVDMAAAHERAHGQHPLHRVNHR